MTDLLEYQTPFWVFGNIFDYFLLKKHLTNLILERNGFIKNFVLDHKDGQNKVRED
jgi:hypothetical protein